MGSPTHSCAKVFLLVFRSCTSQLDEHGHSWCTRLETYDFYLMDRICDTVKILLLSAGTTAFINGVFTPSDVGCNRLFMDFTFVTLSLSKNKNFPFDKKERNVLFSVIYLLTFFFDIHFRRFSGSSGDCVAAGITLVRYVRNSIYYGN